MKRYVITAGALVLAACADGNPTAPVSELTPSTNIVAFDRETPPPGVANGWDNRKKGQGMTCHSGTEDTQNNPGYGPYNGKCKLMPWGAMIDTYDGDMDPNNAYAGVYDADSELEGTSLSDVEALGFSYAGEGATGGSPRLSIPIDEEGDGGYDDFAFVDTLGCNDGDANVGTLDVIGDPTCTISYNNVSYANWDAFVGAYPNAKIGEYFTFMVADQPGKFKIFDAHM